jgi:hypothetical protein
VHAQALLLLLGPLLFKILEQLIQVPLIIELDVGSHEQVEELAFQVKVRTQSQALLVKVPTA